MIINQKVRVRNTNEYGYISIPLKVEIVWENSGAEGKAMLDDLEFIGGRFKCAKAEKILCKK